MEGLDTEVVLHKLAFTPNFLLEKQEPRKMKFDLEEKSSKKLIEIGFIRDEKYLD